MKRTGEADDAGPIEVSKPRKRVREERALPEEDQDLLAGAVADKTPKYSPTAYRILATARKIVVEQGIDALTFERIASEAPVNKGATRYYFGNKDGLLAAMFDELVMSERWPRKALRAEPANVGQRLDVILEKVRFMLSDRDSFVVFLEMLPVALRNQVLRSRVERLQNLWVEWLIEGLGFDPQTKSEDVRAVGRLCLAVIDGLGIQREIHRDPRQSEIVLDLLRQPLSDCLARIGQIE